MEISQVRKQVKSAIERAKGGAQQRRERMTAAENSYDTFLEQVATPVTRQVANALKSEGYAFTVFTPGGGLRLAADRGRDDFVEFWFDTTGDRPQVMARISRVRGSRTLEDERPVKKDAAPGDISEGEMLAFLLEALQPWLER